MRNTIFIDQELANILPAEQSALFDFIFSLDGEVFRNVKNRKTMRVSWNGKNYFIKIHRGVGYREIFKNWSQLKRPVLGAQNEYDAIRHMERIGVPTMTCRAFALRGTNIAKLDSFIITDELTDVISLEDFCRDWKANPPSSELKHGIIAKLAETCAKMHFSGLNHKDCYICHFLLDKRAFAEGSIRLKVLDLHRAEIRRRVPLRLQIKDLAGIFFSSMDCGLSKIDMLRFIAKYSSYGKISRNTWNRVLHTAIRLYRKEWGRTPDLPCK